MEQITRKEWGKHILLVFVIIVMIQSFTLCKVEGKSMQPTLQEDDYVFVNKVAAHFPLSATWGDSCDKKRGRL
ncbi:Signal peptidase I [Bacillus mycoides]|nr:Signal peptidase I [Bacillus mycoides]